MEDVTDVHILPLSSSKYLNPKCVYFNQNGKKRKWECITEHSGVSEFTLYNNLVAILLFNTSRDVFVFVKQFRPAVYIQNAEAKKVNGEEVINTRHFPPSLGITIELCAGIVDKDAALTQVAQAEVLQECGYDVPENKLLKITSFRNGTGTSGAVVNLYYAEVTDAMRVSKGGGLASEGELIEVVEMTVTEARQLIFDEDVNREASSMFALLWFFQNVWPHKQNCLK
ncbi:unnamed protein product [Candidula unifasciata]|uniref:Uridine diphosphate glucose pyrophosphatase NUDT14 n=1 Tax=Candidula unifasciata TaxID=100452 RepID=A0A8S4A3X4_9EUPU|nr:unnamed protein product [Candidula unifasciata]